MRNSCQCNAVQFNNTTNYSLHNKHQQGLKRHVHMQGSARKILVVHEILNSTYM